VSRPRQLPWIPVLLSALILAGAALATDPIRNAVTREVIADARLERSLGYVVLGPISSVLDALTLFTVGQIIGFTLWIVALHTLARYAARRHKPVGVGRELLYAAASFAALLAVYGAAVALPRPMAKLVITRSDAIAVDFHSHTHYSHDGRSGWTPEDVLDWHAAAGFNVAFITDHATLDGIRESLALDTTAAGQSTLLLSGIELFYHGEHVNLLNAGTRFRGLTTEDFRSVDDQALALASQLQGFEPVLIETIPGDLSAIHAATGPRTPGVRAIEIVDGSPRGMSQARRDHDRIVRLADSLQLALVAGSDNHGWGRTAPGWTMLRVNDWRGLSPEALSIEIETILRAAGPRGTQVVERTTASAAPLAVAFTLPVVAWTISRTLSADERVAWIFWIWVPWLILLAARRRTRRLRD
jgi:hypothetical protein